MRVRYLSDNYDFIGHGAIGYGVAWYQGSPQSTPEPGTLALLSVTFVPLFRRRRLGKAKAA